MFYQTRINQIENANIFRFQKTLSIFCIIAVIIAIIINIFTYTQIPTNDIIFNIITIIPIALPFIITYIFNNKIARWFQIILLFSIGILSILFGVRTQYFGDIAIILSILLIIKYKVIKPNQFKIWHVITICIAIMLLRFFSQTNTPVTISLNIITTLLSGMLIGFSLLIIQDDVNLNIRINNENQTMIRYGYNFGALLHEINFIEIIDTLNNLSAITENSIAKRKIELIQAELQKNEYLQNLFLENFKKNYDFLCKDENIVTIIDLIIKEEEKIHSKINIQFTKQFALNNITVTITPFEFQCIIRNIINNAIESIIQSENSLKIILIQTFSDEKFICIQIDDSGNAFPKNFQLSEKQGKGYGLKYITEIIEHYNWTVNFNKSELMTGASILIKIPKKGVIEWH